jgi:hypothetical protein
VAAALTAVAIVRVPAAAHADTQPLTSVLARAGAYVDALEQSFSQVIGAEDYQQTVLAPGGRTESRNQQSEVFFVRLDEASAWMMVRNVLKVDGRPVRGSHDRIMDALSGSSPQHRARLRALADEGARYNIGNVRRNFSDPMLALTFLDRSRQPRFAFAAAGPAAVDGSPVQRVRFDERDRPTIIRDGRTGTSVPAHGQVDVAADGRVLRTELQLDVDSRTSATLRVTFAPDARLGVLVPTLMEEHYRTVSSRDSVVITCTAVYSDFRRFETAVRVVP